MSQKEGVISWYTSLAHHRYSVGQMLFIFAQLTHRTGINSNTVSQKIKRGSEEARRDTDREGRWRLAQFQKVQLP